LIAKLPLCLFSSNYENGDNSTDRQRDLVCITTSTTLHLPIVRHFVQFRLNTLAFSLTSEATTADMANITSEGAASTTSSLALLNPHEEDPNETFKKILSNFGFRITTTIAVEFTRTPSEPVPVELLDATDEELLPTPFILSFTEDTWTPEQETNIRAQFEGSGWSILVRKVNHVRVPESTTRSNPGSRSSAGIVPTGTVVGQATPHSTAPVRAPAMQFNLNKTSPSKVARAAKSTLVGAVEAMRNGLTQVLGKRIADKLLDDKVERRLKARRLRHDLEEEPEIIERYEAYAMHGEEGVVRDKEEGLGGEVGHVRGENDGLDEEKRVVRGENEDLE
jgi:hypothetical protein